MNRSPLSSRQSLTRRLSTVGLVLAVVAGMAGITAPAAVASAPTSSNYSNASVIADPGMYSRIAIAGDGTQIAVASNSTSA